MIHLLLTSCVSLGTSFQFETLSENRFDCFELLFSLLYTFFFFFLNCCQFCYGFLLSGPSHCSYLSVAFSFFCFSFLLSANDNQHTDGKPVLDYPSSHVRFSFLSSAITHSDARPTTIHPPLICF